MKKFVFMCFMVSFLAAAPAFAAGGIIKVDVNGLICDFCARALEKVFGKEAAVSGIGVDLDAKLVTINLKDGQDMDDARVTKLITDSGYSVEKITRDE